MWNETNFAECAESAGYELYLSFLYDSLLKQRCWFWCSKNILRIYYTPKHQDTGSKRLRCWIIRCFSLRTPWLSLHCNYFQYPLKNRYKMLWKLVFSMWKRTNIYSWQFWIRMSVLCQDRLFKLKIIVFTSSLNKTWKFLIRTNRDSTTSAE